MLRILTAAIAALSSAVAAETITVDGTAAIYGAGVGGSTAPEVFDFTPAAGLFITAAYQSGGTNCCGLGGVPFAGADGAAFFGSGTSAINPLNGVSGITAPSQMFLVGVFVDSADLPMAGDTPPATLNFSGGTSFTSLSPLLNQAFWVGDGLTGTGTGTSQQFIAPTGADQLLLGFADAAGFSGNPGFYSDNPGSLTMEITANAAASPVPLPASTPLLIAGLGMLALMRRKR